MSDGCQARSTLNFPLPCRPNCGPCSQEPGSIFSIIPENERSKVQSSSLFCSVCLPSDDRGFACSATGLGSGLWMTNGACKLRASPTDRAHYPDTVCSFDGPRCMFPLIQRNPDTCSRFHRMSETTLICVSCPFPQFNLVRFKSTSSAGKKLRRFGWWMRVLSAPLHYLLAAGEQRTSPISFPFVLSFQCHCCHDVEPSRPLSEGLAASDVYHFVPSPVLACSRSFGL